MNLLQLLQPGGNGEEVRRIVDIYIYIIILIKAKDTQNHIQWNVNYPNVNYLKRRLYEPLTWPDRSRDAYDRHRTSYLYSTL